jgi:hypothetical protein
LATKIDDGNAPFAILAMTTTHWVDFFMVKKIVKKSMALSTTAIDHPSNG